MENKLMSEEEFLAKQGKWFFIRLMKYWQMYTTDIEQLEQKDDDILQFEFNEGVYRITFLDLKTKADQETLEFLKYLEETNKQQNKEENGTEQPTE